MHFFRMIRRGVPVALPAAILLLWLATPRTSYALPAFARKFNVTCSSCHSAVPYLNRTGRRFKEAGYRMPDEDGEVDIEEQNLVRVTDQLYLEKVPPVSARAVVRPLILSKVEGGDVDRKQDSLHEFEVLVAGNVHALASFYFELEGEDEENFEVGGAGLVGFHPSVFANVMVGWGDPFRADPYNTLRDGGHRLTVAHKAPLSMTNGAGAVLRAKSQFITVYGRASMLYYALGLTGRTKDTEGEEAKSLTFRLAVEPIDELAIGAFGWLGPERDEADIGGSGVAGKVSFLKVGGDLSLDYDDIHFAGVFLMDKTTLSPTGGNEASTTELGAYGEVFYTYTVGGRPLIMPLLRVDYTTENDGKDKTIGLAANVSSYVFENVRIGLEFDSDLSVPDSQKKSWGLTLMGDIIF